MTCGCHLDFAEWGEALCGSSTSLLEVPLVNMDSVWSVSWAGRQEAQPTPTCWVTGPLQHAGWEEEQRSGQGRPGLPTAAAFLGGSGHNQALCTSGHQKGQLSKCLADGLKGCFCVMELLTLQKFDFFSEINNLLGRDSLCTVILCRAIILDKFAVQRGSRFDLEVLGG